MKTAKDITLQEFLDNLDFVSINDSNRTTLLMTETINVTITEDNYNPKYVLCYDKREYLKKELERIKNYTAGREFNEDELLNSMISLRHQIDKYIEDLDSYCEGR